MLYGTRYTSFRYPIFEADGDENTQQQNQNTDQQTADNNQDNAPAENTQDNDNTENQDQNQDENQDAGGDDEFNIDADADIDTGDDAGGDTGGGGGGGTSVTPEEEEPVDNEDTRRDKELYDSLSPQEQKERNIQLKTLFFRLYSNCDYVIDKLNNISDADLEEYGVQVRKTLSMLFDLKQMVSDYATKLYDSKSYIENDIMFNRYLSILNTVKNITSDIRKSYKTEEDTQGTSK